MILYSALQTRKGTTEIQDKHAIKIIKIRMEIHELDKETTEEKKKNQWNQNLVLLKISVKLINFEPDCGRLNNGPSKDMYALIPETC